MSQININQLGVIVNAVNLAQKRGAFTLQEAAQLAEPVATLTTFLQEIAKQNTEAPSTEAPSTEAQSTDENTDTKVV